MAHRCLQADDKGEVGLPTGDSMYIIRAGGIFSNDAQWLLQSFPKEREMPASGLNKTMLNSNNYLISFLFLFFFSFHPFLPSLPFLFFFSPSLSSSLPFFPSFHLIWRIRPQTFESDPDPGQMTKSLLASVFPTVKLDCCEN